MRNLEAVIGDITQADVDAIVNAANPAMLGGGGVDGAIHRAAGPELLEACKQVPLVDGLRCPFGEARITAAGNLPSKFVIHTVGPIYASDPVPEATLRSAYRNSLLLASENKCASIAFPAISCGAYGFPLNEAADIAIQTCADDLFSEISIRFFLFSTELHEIWSKRIDDQ
ncbi:MAG: O-acetyl-ADP-ribose deacetylase [Pseudomonadota bacterium]